MRAALDALAARVRGRAAPGAWSLVGRLTGGVVLIALLSLAAQALVLTLWLQPALDDMVAIATDQALSVQTALQAVPESRRAALAERLSNAAVTVASHPPQLPADALPGPAGWPGAVPDALREPPPDADPQSRDEITLRVTPRGGGGNAAQGGIAMVFRLPVGDQVWWLSRVQPAPTGALPGTLLVWLLLLGGATVGALLVSVRLIARPLARLAQQIALQQGRLRPLPEPGDASAELQALVRAFNQLVQQVTAAAQQRQQLLAGVSHDLRTPLARLRLRAETQCEPALADALDADLRALERIADQFLAYVHSDSALPLGAVAPLSNSVHDAVQPYIANSADSADVWLQFEPVALPVPDLALQRLLCNLIDNALAHGRPPVQVALHAMPGGGAELAVCDCGTGMSDADFVRAQQPFVRLTRTRGALGHCGLGLAIVAQIARQLGGTLGVRRIGAGPSAAAGGSGAVGADGGGAAAPRFAIVLALPAPATAVSSVIRRDMRSPQPHRSDAGAA